MPTKQQRQLWTEQEAWKSIIDQLTIWPGDPERDYTLFKLTSILLGLLNCNIFGIGKFRIKSSQVKEYLQIKFADRIYIKDKQIFLKGVDYISLSASKILNNFIKG